MKRMSYASLALVLAVTWLTSCTTAMSGYPRVSLTEEPADLTTVHVSSTTSPALRVAIATVISPKNTVRSYSPFLDYLARRMGRPVELVQGRTYQEVNNLVRDREVDFALVCSGAYVRGHADFGMELLAAPEVEGQTVYYSYLIVPTNSSAQSLADLRGKTFAFTDPMSNSGWLTPVYMLRQMGETPEKFFRHTIYTYSHDYSIRAVADGLVDGASVDSLVYLYAIRHDPTLSKQVRVVARSAPSATPPAVVHPDLDPKEKALLREALLTMHQDLEGRAALSSLLIDRFVTIEDAAYDSVRQALRKVRDPL